MHLRDLTKHLFFNHRKNHKDEYYGSRFYFTLEACTGHSINSLTTGAFIAGFASLLGASDRYTGLLASIPMVAGMSQLFAPLILEKLPRRKGVVTSFFGIHRMLLSLIVFIPLLIPGTSLRLAALFTLVSISYLSINLVWPGFTSWLVSVVPESKRGRYFGIKDSCSLAVSTVITLTMGFVLDSFKKKGAVHPDYTGFVVVFSVALVLSILNILILTKIKEPPVELSKDRVKIMDCIIKPLKDKVYMKVVIFFILWNVGLNVGSPFLAVYQVKYLQLDYKYIMLLGMLTTMTAVIIVIFWGKFADKYSWVHSAIFSISVLSLGHFIWGFITAKTLFLLPIVFIFGGIAWGGVTISLFNLPFIFVPEENKTIYLGFNAALGGISGLLATLAGGQIVSLFGQKVFNIGFITVGGIQVVALLTSFILLSCVIYANFTLKKMVKTKKIS